MSHQRLSPFHTHAHAVLAVTLSMLGAPASTLAQDTTPSSSNSEPPAEQPNDQTLPPPKAATPDTAQAAAQAEQAPMATTPAAPRSRIDASTPPASPPASPLSAPADPKRVYRMHAWLKYMSHAGLVSRVLDGVGNGVLTSIYAVTGVAVLGASADTSRQRTARNTVAAGLLGVSAGYLYAALTNMSPTTDELRFDRWKLAAGNIDALTLARFESELETEARLATWFQLRSAGTMIGLGTAGALLLAFTPASDFEGGDRTFSYVMSGVMFAGGAFAAIFTLLSEPLNVRAYRLYSEGKDPDEDDKPARAREKDRKQFNVDPMVSAREAGLILTGRF